MNQTLAATLLTALLPLTFAACAVEEEEGTDEMEDFDPGAGIAADAPSGRAIITTPDGDREIGYDVVGGHALAQGDIDLGPVARLRRPGEPIPRANSNLVFGNQWPSNTILYVRPTFNVTAILAAIADLDAKTQVNFVELPVALPGVAMLRFVPSLDPGVSSSAVGYQGGLQSIKVWPTHGRSVIEHEIGHALGLWHEQQRIDRNAFVNINWFCMPSSRWHNFDVEGLPLGAYDFNSIMHYGSFSFSSVSGCPVMTKKNGSTFSASSALSAGDIAAINTMY